MCMRRCEKIYWTTNKVKPKKFFFSALQTTVTFKKTEKTRQASLSDSHSLSSLLFSLIRFSLTLSFHIVNFFSY